MPATVNANNKTVVHAGSTGMSTGAPDTCKTPTPGGPVPIPYPNIAMSSDAAQVSTTVKVDGNGIMIEGSNFAMSSGDEAGSAMGVSSNKIKGKMEFQNHSTDVKVDGKPVARLTDPTENNDKNKAMCAAETQGPQAVAPPGESDEQQKACEELEKKRVGRNATTMAERIDAHEQAAKDAGMLPGDYDSFRLTCQTEKATIAFRDTNPACSPHLAAGVPSKGHDVLTKTFPADNLPPDSKQLAGLVSTLDKKPPPGQIIQNPQGCLRQPPLTGDYDMFDMLDTNDTRIRGESARDFAIRDSLNGNLPNGGNPPRIMHGSQAAYPDYLEQHPGEKPIKFPPEKTLTVFDKSGEVYRLESEEDIANFYKCKGVENPNDRA